MSYNGSMAILMMPHSDLVNTWIEYQYDALQGPSKGRQLVLLVVFLA